MAVAGFTITSLWNGSGERSNMKRFISHYLMVSDVRQGLLRYFPFYNRERLHTSLGNRTPYEVYFKQPIPLNLGQACQTMHQMYPHFLS